MPTTNFYYSLDFWRGVACLLVILFHSTFYFSAQSLDGRAGYAQRFFQCTWVGVPLFFVISGYCISASADKMRHRPNVEPGAYFGKRFRRIFPPYWICLGLTLLFVWGAETWIQPQILFESGHGFPNPAMMRLPQWVGNVTLTETWRPRIAGGGESLFLGHAWTLCYEEQFYIVMGILLFLFPRRLFAAALIVTVACIPARTLLPKMGFYPLGFWFDGQWFAFASGIAVYSYVNYAKTRPQRVKIAALFIPTLLYCFHYAESLSVKFTYERSVLYAVLFAIALIALHPFDARLSASRCAQPISRIGLMCYSVYLVHYPVTRLISHVLYLHGLQSLSATVLVTLPACLLTSLLAAHIFHTNVETRFYTPLRTGIQDIHNAQQAPHSTS